MSDDDLKRAHGVVAAGLQLMVNVAYNQGAAAAASMLLMGLAIKENYGTLCSEENRDGNPDTERGGGPCSPDNSGTSEG